MTDLIKPPHAISIWASKEILYVELPPAHTGVGQSHILKLPLNIYGLTQIVNILRSRTPQSKLGQLGDPTQFQSDRAVNEMQRLATGYKGPIEKEAKVTLTQELSLKVKDAIRRFVNV